MTCQLKGLDTENLLATFCHCGMFVKLGNTEVHQLVIFAGLKNAGSTTN
jgi:hypothetical protein